MCCNYNASWVLSMLLFLFGPEVNNIFADNVARRRLDALSYRRQTLRATNRNRPFAAAIVLLGDEEGARDCVLLDDAAWGFWARRRRIGRQWQSMP